MKQLKIESLQKIHNRNLDITSYIVDTDHLLITGQLKEKNLITVYVQSGETTEPDIFHHMEIQLLVKTSELKIVDLHVKYLVHHMMTFAGKWRIVLTLMLHKQFMKITSKNY